jgi:hypothetical protein
MIRGFLGTALQLLLTLSFLLLLFSVLLWGLACFWWGYALENYTFIDLLVFGLLRFWQDGPGGTILGVTAAMAAYCMLGWLTDFWNLKNKRKTVNRDIESRATDLAAKMRKDIEAQVIQTHKAAAAELRGWENRLAEEREDLAAREKKVDAYLEELKALRGSHARYDMEFQEIRRRAQQAHNALSREAPMVGEAKMLIEKIVQMA